MHRSERLLHLHLTIDRQTRLNLQQRITNNLGDGKELSSSYEELTHQSSAFNPSDVKTSADFEAWLRGESKDEAFLTYYLALLEHTLTAQTTPSAAPAVEVTEEKTLETPPEKPAKPRYVAEKPVPSRSERMAFHPNIQPARPKKRRTALVLLPLLLLLLAGGGYVAYPYVTAFFDSTQEVTSPEPVEVQTPEVEETSELPEPMTVWVNTKNVNLINQPGGANVVYEGDIGDKYEVVTQRDNHFELALGSVTGWVPETAVTTDWPTATLTDSALLSWITSNLDTTFSSPIPSEYLALNEAGLYEAIGQPFGEESDQLNTYAFYRGIFFTIQEAEVHAIDWTNTGVTKEAFLSLGEPTIETEDAVVYESESYSLRLFIGANASTRIRLTEI